MICFTFVGTNGKYKDQQISHSVQYRLVCGVTCPQVSQKLIGINNIIGLSCSETIYVFI